MTQGFRDRFLDLADFVIINGFYEFDPKEIPPESGLAAKGFKPPFYGWFPFNQNMENARQSWAKGDHHPIEGLAYVDIE